MFLFDFRRFGSFRAIAQAARPRPTELARDVIPPLLAKGEPLMCEAMPGFWPPRLLNALINSNSEPLDVLVQRNEAYLLKTRGMGRKTLKLVEDALADLGLRLKMTQEEWDAYLLELNS